MKRVLIIISCVVAFASCKNDKKDPDVSNIKIDLQLQRFEEDFFTIDTNNIHKGISSLSGKYPVFINDYMSQILGFTAKSHPDTLAKYVKLFIRDYRFVKDSADVMYKSFEPQLKEIKHGLQHVKYYFPEYKFPTKIITYIGPFDGFSATINSDAFGVGLQLYMGSNFSFYNSEVAQNLFPEYIITRFTPEYIPINLMKNVVEDMYPDKSIGRPLIEQMIEKGKRLYLLDKFLPKTEDHLKIGYTKKQFQDCNTNEAVIWDFFLNNDLLNAADQDLTKNYIGEGPKTQELGEDAPGNIGSYTGWQIVKKYMEKNPDMTLQKLMATSARDIYNGSKYKPKA